MTNIVVKRTAWHSPPFKGRGAATAIVNGKSGLFQVDSVTNNAMLSVMLGDVVRAYSLHGKGIVLDGGMPHAPETRYFFLTQNV